jgi:hypothetical protein
MFATGIAKRYRGVLATVLGCVRRVEAFLGPADDWVESDRRIVYEAADGLFGHSAVSKGNEEDYLFTANTTTDEIERLLHERGFERNLLSTRKYRITREHHTGNRQWADGSWVLSLGNERQLHIYLFSTKYGNADVYSHVEPSVVNPVAHLDTDTGVHGDPTNTVTNVLSENGIDTTTKTLT